jgi:hypothetical protein
MDGYKHEGMSDEALEREIEAALGVDPSPEFLPRVRERIANDRVHDGWLWSAPWRWTGAVAVVTAVAIIGVWTLRDPAPVPREASVTTTPPVETTTPPAEADGPAPALVASSAEAPKAVRAPAVRAVRSPQRPQVVASFDVVISPDEAAALKQLFTAISDRRIEASVLPDLQSALKPPVPIEEIVLEPITINPLAALEGE